MAFHFGPADQLAENAEINVTPFIDVMLVLLIIFMVAAPLSTVDAPVDLPVSTAKPAPRTQKPVIVSIKADLTVLVGNDAVALDQMASALDVATGIRRDERVFLRADKAVSYGDLTRVMNALRAAGYLKVALVGMEDGKPATEGPAVVGPAR